MNDGLTILDKEFYIKEILSVHCWEWTEEEIAKRHEKMIHRHADVLICVLHGEAIYETEHNRYHLKAGDCVYLSAGCNYRHYILSEKYKNVFVDFFFDKPETQILPSTYFQAIEGIDLAFIKLYKKWIFRNPAYQSECMSILYNIYSQLICSESLSYMPKSKKELFEAAVQTISNNYANEELSVAMLAANAQMSEVHFRKCFRKIYHVSPQQYIIDIRITHAKNLLLHHRDSINFVAQASGFSDSCYFCRIFKQKTGYTPLEYRKNFGIL